MKSVGIIIRRMKRTNKKILDTYNNSNGLSV